MWINQKTSQVIITRIAVEVKYSRNDCEGSANNVQERRTDFQTKSSEWSCKTSARNSDPTLFVCEKTIVVTVQQKEKTKH